MRVLIASDIHGSEYRAKQVYDIWKNENIEQVILLGDLLYHGPRNDLPPFYKPKGVIPLLSEMKDSIVAVRGNCDAEVDQMVLPFNISDITRTLTINGKKAFLHHGHHSYNIGDAEIVLSGHTHIPVLEEKEGVLYLNPGSTTIPKGDSRPSLAIWDNNKIEIIGLDDRNVIYSWKY